MTRERGTGLDFLTITEAARHLGVQGLRLREAAGRGLVPSQRDNEGRLRVDLTGIERLPEADESAPPLDPGALMGFLFDEVEELQAHLAQKEDEVAALSALVKKQGAAMERAEAALKDGEPASASREAELKALLDRTMGLLEQQAGAAEQGQRIRGSLEKSMELLELALERTDETERRSDEQVNALRSELTTTRGQLDRTLALSERALAGRADARDQTTEEEKGKPGFWARIFGR